MKKLSSIEEYRELDKIVSEAQDGLVGEYNPGVHYNLAWILRGYGIVITDRADTVRQGKNLLSTFEKENFQ